MRTIGWLDCNKHLADAYPELTCRRQAGHTGQCWRVTPQPHLIIKKEKS